MFGMWQNVLKSGLQFPSIKTTCCCVCFIVALKKKLQVIAKEKDCEIVGQWTKSLLNHLYWSAASTEDGNGDVIN